MITTILPNIKQKCSIIKDCHDNINTTHREYIERVRLEKQLKYIVKRNNIINIINSLPIGKDIDFEKCYDLFMEHATFEHLDEKKYWNCMYKLGYRFAKWYKTILHTLLFSIFCVITKGFINVTEFLLSIVVFTNASPRIPFNTIINDLFSCIKKNKITTIFNQLPDGSLYFTSVEINGTIQDISVSKDLLEIFYTKMDHHYIIKNVIYSLFEWR
jgi:hypothetical protein